MVCLFKLEICIKSLKDEKVKRSMIDGVAVCCSGWMHGILINASRKGAWGEGGGGGGGGEGGGGTGGEAGRSGGKRDFLETRAVIIISFIRSLSIAIILD